MRFMHRAIAAVVVMATAGATSAGAADRPLTLDQAITLALEKNEGIVVSRESAAAARAATSGARGVYDPVLTLNGGVSRTKVPVNSSFSGAPEGEGAPTTKGLTAGATLSQYLPTGGTLSLSATTGRTKTNATFDLLSPAYQTRVGVEFRQPLLRNLVTDPERESIRVADAERRRSAASLRVTVTETVAEVERAYWRLVAAQAEVEVRDEAVHLAEEQLSETRDRVESGDAPETEMAQPRAELERRRGELLAAREAATHADTALKLLILGDGDGDMWADEFTPQQDNDVETAVIDRADAIDRALASRPELDAAQAALERRAAEASLAHHGTRPSLDAVVSYDRFGLSGSANAAASEVGGNPPTIPSDYDGDWGRSWSMLGDGNYDDVFAGLEFSIPIGNDAAQASEAITRHAKRIAEADLTGARKRVRADVLDAAAALETASQRIQSAKAGREAAEVQLSAEKDRYDVGLSTNFFVLTRQNDLSNARLDEISARADYRIARTELARATGALLEQHRISVDETTQ